VGTALTVYGTGGSVSFRAVFFRCNLFPQEVKFEEKIDAALASVWE
jgi:hypothetical protein